MAPRTVHLRIDAEVGDESLTGRVTAEAGQARQFSGWISLLAALEQLIGAAPDGVGDDQAPRGPPRGGVSPALRPQGGNRGTTSTTRRDVSAPDAE